MLIRAELTHEQTLAVLDTLAASLCDTNENFDHTRFLQATQRVIQGANADVNTVNT